MKTKKCAVIQFPGSNCEYETIHALKQANIDTDLIRWNCSEEDFFSYDAYVLPGGFSFQDRIRAGVVASKLPDYVVFTTSRSKQQRYFRNL